MPPSRGSPPASGNDSRSRGASRMTDSGFELTLAVRDERTVVEFVRRRC